MALPLACNFLTMHVPWPWLRQTSDGMGELDGCTFRINAGLDSSAWLAVFDEPPPQTLTRVPRSRRILFITEPPEVKPYPASYLRQFGLVISPFRMHNCPQHALLQENSCLNWHYGINTATPEYRSSFTSLNEIRNMPVPHKTKMLSVICSTKTYTEAQRKRIAFVEKLAQRFGDAVDIFGRGRNPIDDKADAIRDYKYHLVLENNYADFFWTEKLSDTWLGYAYAIYLGAPNLAQCCPPGALLALQPDSDEANLNRIAQLLEKDPWEKSLPAICACRQWILETTNVFARIARIMRAADAQRLAEPPLTHPVPLRQAKRWHRAILRRCIRWHIYNPFGC